MLNVLSHSSVQAQATTFGLEGGISEGFQMDGSGLYVFFWVVVLLCMPIPQAQWDGKQKAAFFWIRGQVSELVEGLTVVFLSFWGSWPLSKCLPSRP